ncbi:MAG: glycosyltransferase family 2 protein, partial [Candidatus Binatia bacterium]
MVTVTYGDRATHLRRTMDSVLSQPRVRVIVISNGSAKPTFDLLCDYQARYMTRLQFVNFERNRGSAPAFADALRLAYEFADPILVLDDDNPISPATLASLRTLSPVVEQETRAPTALVVHRPVNSAQRSVLAGTPVDEVFRE